VRERGLDVAGLVNWLRGERETVERAIPVGLVNRSDRRLDLAASRVVEPPRRIPVLARANFWLWLVLALLVLSGLTLWYFTRPSVTTASLSGTQWQG
jgi:hypothetical protein